MIVTPPTNTGAKRATRITLPPLHGTVHKAFPSYGFIEFRDPAAPEGARGTSRVFFHASEVEGGIQLKARRLGLSP